MNEEDSLKFNDDFEDGGSTLQKMTLGNPAIECRQCYSTGNLSKFISCCTCGDNYHTTCVGEMNLPGSRTGWNCVQCRKCQICRQPAEIEGRSLNCEKCQKVYHAACMRPMMTSIPKFGWKCSRCRLCSDCGSRTPGAGVSSRWHCHYSVCDSCYQQRNKGFSCPICHKAYRAAAYKEMVKCSWCNRFVHSSCDDEADICVYHSRKENNPDYDYVCPPCNTIYCKTEKKGVGQHVEYDVIDNEGHNRINPLESSVMEKTCKYPNLDGMQDVNPNTIFSRGKPYEIFKLSKKRTVYKEAHRNRGGKLVLQKASAFTQYNRKRGARGKGRSASIPTDKLHVDQSENGHIIDIATDSKMLFCSAKDQFVLSQDVCVMCGSVGIEQEGYLIACSQCGQCYHPFCVNIRVNEVVLKKGWRCLDCTICEGCGEKNDEARLILCDECDISYHIYCINPPLDTVPHGNWKCKWCAICNKCGRQTPGKNSQWMNSFSECGPCASQSICCVCSKPYNENTLIIECANCERWLHCNCDSILNEEDAQKCNNDYYHCILCRSEDEFPPQNYDGYTNIKQVSPADQNYDNEPNSGVTTEHWIDGVCVSEQGFNIIKTLGSEIKKKRKMRLLNDVQNQESAINAAIESVVAGSATENKYEDALHLNTQPKNCKYAKDGMIWTASEGSPPTGFSILTNDEGLNILRKKRQRNLQKVGIGGFTVRNRANKKQFEESTSVTYGDKLCTVEKKKKGLRKRNKIVETFPTYLQEAFFGKTLLASSKNLSPFWESDTLKEFTIKDSSTKNITDNYTQESSLSKSLSIENKLINAPDNSICNNKEEIQDNNQLRSGENELQV